MSKKWMEAVQQKVADCWEWHSPAMQVGFRFAKPSEGDDFWEVWAYPAVQEIVGGKEDGETVWSGYNFDVLQFLQEFESKAIATSTRRKIAPAELRFEGKFQGSDILLHLCMEPPDDIDATEILDVRGEEPVIRDKD